MTSGRSERTDGRRKKGSSYNRGYAVSHGLEPFTCIRVISGEAESRLSRRRIAEEGEISGIADQKLPWNLNKKKRRSRVGKVQGGRELELES